MVQAMPRQQLVSRFLSVSCLIGVDIGDRSERVVGQSSCIGGLADGRHGRRSCLASSTKHASHTYATYIGPSLIAKLRTPSSDVGDGNCYMTNALLRMTSYHADDVHSAGAMLGACLPRVSWQNICYLLEYGI
jgi:hypothetical protein